MAKAADINVCTFTGNVVADPKVHEYGEGKKLARIRMAVNQGGDRDAAFIDLTTFNGLAEKVVIPHVHKGSQIAVSARVETRTEDDRGENRTRTGFVVNELRLLGSPNGNGSGSSSSTDEEPPPF